MNREEYFFRYMDLGITILLLVAGVLFLWLGTYLNNQNGFFVNLSAGSFTSIITIWGIEYLRNKRDRKRKEELTITAKLDTWRLKNMLVSYIAGPLGFSITDYEYKKEEYPNIDDWTTATLPLLIDEILSKDLERILSKMDFKQWQSFAINLIYLKGAIKENIQTYADILGPELHGKIIKIRMIFNNINDQFSVFIDILTKPESEWPVNKYGPGQNKLIKEAQIKVLSKEMNTYFTEIKNLAKLI